MKYQNLFKNRITIMIEELKMVKICPMCHSSRVDLWLGRGGGNMYKCLDCAYQGALIIEVEDDIAKSIDDFKEKNS